MPKSLSLTDLETAVAQVQTRMPTIDKMLMELIALAGQCGHAPSVLELVIDDVTTRAWTIKSKGATWLVVSAMLPKFYSIYPLFIRASTAADFNDASGFAAKREMLWLPETGRYIALAKVPAQALPDQRAIMDTILETADMADNFRQTRCGKAYIL